MKNQITLNLDENNCCYYDEVFTIALLRVSTNYIKVNIQIGSEPIQQRFLKLGERCSLTSTEFFLKYFNKDLQKATFQFI